MPRRTLRAIAWRHCSFTFLLVIVATDSSSSLLNNEFVPCLSMFYVCFCCGLDDSTFFKWQSWVNDDGATMMMHRAMAPSIRIQQWLLDFAAKSIQNENNNKPPSIWPASISQLAWGSDAWLEGGQSISDCL
jgi:hypothetical protein